MRTRSAFADHPRRAGFVRIVALVALLAAAIAPQLGVFARPAIAQDEVVVGLITKFETNPFFVKMKEGAEKAAAENNVRLLTAAGKSETDNQGQVTALENMVNAGAKGILITPINTKAIVPAIEKAREAGVLVISLDTPTDPEDAVDALFATDNFKAGVLIGQYAKAAMGDREMKIATLDAAPGITVSALRHNGFLTGLLGPEASSATPTTQNSFIEDPRVVCAKDITGGVEKAQTGMENCLQSNPDINVLYTINEPTAFGAYTALQAADKEKDVLIVSVDGGCAGVEGVRDGRIAATSQQYPLRMAQLGVEAVVKFAQTGEKPSGYTDTGVTLITDQPQAGVESEDTAYGLENCWG